MFEVLYDYYEYDYLDLVFVGIRDGSTKRERFSILRPSNAEDAVQNGLLAEIARNINLT